MLLAPAWQRLLIAGTVVAALWVAVLYVAPSAPTIGPAQPTARTEAAPITASLPVDGGLRAVVRSGFPAPGGGIFDRFDVPSAPVAAPVNGRGQVAFYATVLHAAGREGIFLAEAGRVRKVAAFGDDAPGGGTLADFGEHPLPVLNAAGHVAFAARIAGGRATEGVFLAGEDGLHAIALAGDEAPGVPAGVLAEFQPPVLNDNDEMAFVARVRRGREALDVLYFWNGRRLQRVVGEREILLRIGGTMDAIGEPALNNVGVIAFPAAILKGPAVGGIFVGGARPLQLVVSSGDRTPSGDMILRFSERLAIDDGGGIAFGAFVGESRVARGAVLRYGPDGLAEVAVEGGSAPGGGRYVGFGPWVTAAPDGTVAFLASLEDGPSSAAAFAGLPGSVARRAAIGDTLPRGGRIGPFAPNAIVSAASGGAVAFVTLADEAGGRGAVYCRCPPNP
jgi:hypothetical protein